MIKAGFSRVDVTPPLGTYLWGYFNHRYAKGIIDPLYLNALAISDGFNRALIIAADMLGISEEFATPIRKKIAESVGLKENHIIITSLHQHTSISLITDPLGDNTVVEDRAYLNVLQRKFCDAARMAIDDMSEATLGLAEMQAIEQISFIRRFRMKDGSTKTNASRKPGMLHPIGEPDNTVRLLKFVREGKNDIALVNFSTHPDTVGGELYSADWPGYTRNYVEADHGGVYCIVVNGAQGDTNHISYTKDPLGKGGPQARYMARVIADTVNELWVKDAPIEDVKIDADVEFVYQKTRSDDNELYDECKEKLRRVFCGMAIPGELDKVGGNGGAYRIVCARTSPLFQKVAISVVSLGKICFVGFGGEPFTRYAAAVREAVPDRYIIALCCANGYERYLPTREAFLEGGYESVSSLFNSDVEDECVNTAIKIIKGFDK